MGLRAIRDLKVGEVFHYEMTPAIIQRLGIKPVLWVKTGEYSMQLKGNLYNVSKVKLHDPDLDVLVVPHHPVPSKFQEFLRRL